MIYILLGTMFIVIYLGLIWATILKFNYNGLKLNLRCKMLLSLSPIYISYKNLVITTKMINKDRSNSLKVISKMLTKYPIIIGLFIEIMLENTGKSYLNSIKEGNDSILFNSTLSYIREDYIYEKELLNPLL